METAAGSPQEIRQTFCALSDIKVIEFSHVVMGPVCGQILGHLGADVIKVEPPPEGETARRLKGQGSGYFTFYNTNKRSLMIDLKFSEGKAVCYRLIDQADVVIENYAPGTLEKLGFGYEAIQMRNPRIIFCSLKGFLEGPYQNRLGLDEMIEMMSGLAFMNGLPGKPMRVGASVLDVLGGVFGVVGILTALREREVSGKGKRVEVGLFETAAYLMGQHMAQAALQKSALVPMSVRTSAWGVYDLFKSKDGEDVFIGITSDSQWMRFCQAFDFQELLANGQLKSNEERISARSWLLPMLQAKLSTLSLASILQLCEQAGIAFAPVLSPEALFTDAHMQFGNLLPTRLPEGEMALLPNLPMTLDGAKSTIRLQPPAPGEHNHEIIEQERQDWIRSALQTAEDKSSF